MQVLGDFHPPRIWDRLRRPKTQPDAAELNLTGLDAVVGLVASELLDAVLALHPGMPALHVTDATLGFMREAYGWQVPKNRREAN